MSVYRCGSCRTVHGGSYNWPDDICPFCARHGDRGYVEYANKRVREYLGKNKHKPTTTKENIKTKISCLCKYLTHLISDNSPYRK